MDEDKYMLVGDVLPTNISKYVHWLQVTDEHMGQLAPPHAMAMWPLYSSV
jgi:hypothetical protein